MTELNTEDCKKFLVNRFPKTRSSLWKRVTKYKNTEGLHVRVFQYNSDKMVALLENNGELSIVKENSILERQNEADMNFQVTREDREEFPNGFDSPSGFDSFKVPVRDKDEIESLTGQFHAGASKFIFAVQKVQMEMMDLGSAIFVGIVEYDFWKATGYMNDDCTDEPAQYMPPEWQAEDVNDGGQWLIYTNLTPDELEAKMKSIGFRWEKDFDDYVNQ